MAASLSSAAVDFTPAQNAYEAAIAFESNNTPKVVAAIPFGLELKAQDPNPHCAANKAVSDGWGKCSTPKAASTIALAEKRAVAAPRSKTTQEIGTSYAMEGIT